jgi:hypothetical protein
MAQRFAAACTAWVLVAGAICSLISVPSARAEGAENACEAAVELTILASPIAPWKGAPLRVIFAVEKAVDGEFSLVAPDGTVAVASRERHGGPPYFWYAEVAAPAAGTWRAKLAREGRPSECGTLTREIAVAANQPARPGMAQGTLWPLRNVWNRATENLYSAWIEKLFDAPVEDTLSWRALHEVLRDRSRNVLFNHLGLGEDQTGMTIRPDCADLPYFLRAYFAFKMGLPFGYSKCSRGDGGGGPRCHEWFNIQHLEEPRPPPEPKTASRGVLDGFGQTPAGPAPPPKPAGLVPGFARYLPVVADGVHSGSARTRLADDNTDYYPVPLNDNTLRPGTVFADPYGHVLVLAKRVAQTGDAAGILLAVDAQPDGTVARKRFWRGNFLFAQAPALGGPGFKRVRPIVREKNGSLRRLTNAEIAKNPEYADFSLDQGQMTVEAFYDRMDDVMSPSPLDPIRAIKEAITSLEEQVKARVTSIENGRKFQNSGRGDAEMPAGAAIFETTGAWEDFATPSRDLRLLIAIDVVRNFPDRVARRPERYAMPEEKNVASVRTELEGVLAADLAERKFTYPRSDGSPWTLTLKDVLDRAVDIEMAYNLNDCVELRWGAAERSKEASTCKRHAPAAQRAKMTQYRPWFHERRRPPRA